MASSLAITIEDFEQLPQRLVLNHELVDGDLIPMSGNTGIHNRLRDRLVRLLFQVEASNIGRIISEQEYEFGEDAHAPDVSFFSASKLQKYNGRRRIQLFVPDLAIEVASTGDGLSAIMRKKDKYLNFGVSEVWIIDPETRQAFVFSSRGSFIMTDEKVLSTPLIPDFSIKISDLLEDL